jgi:hypothetical protein
MVEPDLFEQIETTIYSHTRKAKPFTAYTITQKIRTVGCHVSHEVIRSTVHLLYHSGGMGFHYTRTLCDVGGKNGSAWVYHHCENSPDRFAKRLKKRVRKQAKDSRK